MLTVTREVLAAHGKVTSAGQGMDTIHAQGKL